MMESYKRDYGHGTWVYSGQYGAIKARLLCSDGVTRVTQRMAITPDTFFSHPCTVQVKHKNVAGYMTFLEGFDLPYGEDQPVAVFQAYQYRKNGFLLPGDIDLVCKDKWPEGMGALTYQCQLAKGHEGRHANYYARKPATLTWENQC